MKVIASTTDAEQLWSYIIAQEAEISRWIYVSWNVSSFYKFFISDVQYILFEVVGCTPLMFIQVHAPEVFHELFHAFVRVQFFLSIMNLLYLVPCTCAKVASCMKYTSYDHVRANTNFFQFRIILKTKFYLNYCLPRFNKWRHTPPGRQWPLNFPTSLYIFSQTNVKPKIRVVGGFPRICIAA